MKTNSAMNEVLLGLGVAFGAWLLLRDSDRRRRARRANSTVSYGGGLKRDWQNLRADSVRAIDRFEQERPIERDTFLQRARAQRVHGASFAADSFEGAPSHGIAASIDFETGRAGREFEF